MSQKQIDQEINTLNILKNLSQAYSEIAAVRMQKTRDTVLSNRDFSDSIDEVFQAVLASYQHEIARIAKQKGGANKITFLSHNGRTVAVFLSANTGLYGDIVQRTMDYFLEDIKESDIEVTIIGRLGRTLFTQLFPNRQFTYFDLPDYNAQQSQIEEIIRHLVQYEAIHLYYGRFKSFIHQEPTRRDISANVSVGNEQKDEYTKYIFEPDLKSILAFFETEIFASIFDQAVRESELAKLASRAYAMDQAEQNITKDISKKKLQRLKVIHRIENKKQLDALSSVILTR